MTAKPKSKAASESPNPRSAARLGAVQALYQIEKTEAPAPSVIEEFVVHRLGREIEGDLYGEADTDFFADIVKGVGADQARIDSALSACLSEKWRLPRLEAILRAILRAGAYEMIARPDVPAKVIIDEYVELARAFFDEGQPGLVNAALDALAKQVRA